jgi:DUF4097 and DUF4098 domain-containing protein YvlB
VTLNAALLSATGSLTVRAEPGCTEATVTIRTNEQFGAAADAVRRADLVAADGRIGASVEGTGSGVRIDGSIVVGDQHGVTGGVHHGDVVMNNYSHGNGTHVVSGHIGTLNIQNGGRSITMRDVHNSTFVISGGTSQIDIEAVVPPGSSLRGETTGADIVTHGELNRVDVESESGDVKIAHADHVKVETEGGAIEIRGQSSTVDARSEGGSVSIAHADTVRARTEGGEIHVGSTNDAVVKSEGGDVRIDDARGNAEAKSVSGTATVHATGTGKVRASSVSNNASVTATPQAIDGGLDAKSVSGTTTGAAKVVAGSSRTSDGSRNFHEASRTGQGPAGHAREA